MFKSPPAHSFQPDAEGFSKVVLANSLEVRGRLSWRRLNDQKLGLVTGAMMAYRAA